MLLSTRDAMDKGDRRHVGEAKRLDHVLDKLNNAIRAYLSSLDPGAMTAADHQRIEEILCSRTTWNMPATLSKRTS